MGDVLARQRNGRVRDVDAGHPRAAARKPHQIHSRPAADVEHGLAGQPVKWHQAKQMMELVEVVFVEIVEEPGRTRLMTRDRQIVDVLVPVTANPAVDAIRRAGAGVLKCA